MEMVAMYSTVLICPRTVQIFLSNLVRVGHFVFTIWPSTEPASRACGIFS